MFTCFYWTIGILQQKAQRLFWRRTKTLLPETLDTCKQLGTTQSVQVVSYGLFHVVVTLEATLTLDYSN